VYLGIDIGTSGVKAVLLDETDRVLAEANAPLEVDRPRPLWSEQDPDAWWHAAEGAVSALRSRVPKGLADLRAIGLSGQMHGATLLGDDDRPLRPAILWNDGRSAAECQALEHAVPELRGITGNLAMPGFTAPKLLWVREHEPAVFSKVARVLLPKDYVRLCMTGDHATDLSDASGTLWVDVGGRRWSERMIEACGLPPSAMPELYEGTEVTGRLRAEVARSWGCGTVPVVAGGGDNAAGAIRC
jgi:xylulokinase